MRSRALKSSEGLWASTLGESLPPAGRRFERFGILGLLDEDPTRANWRHLWTECARGGLRSLELVAVERREARHLWSRAYEVLIQKMETLSTSNSLLGSGKTEEGRIDDEVCLVR